MPGTDEYGGVVNTAILWGNVYQCTVVATFAGGGAFTQDLALSTPGTVLTRSGAGNFTVTLPTPRQQKIVPLSHFMSRAITLAASAQIFLESVSVTAGTVTYVTQAAGTLGTDADPASGDVMRIHILYAGY